MNLSYIANKIIAKKPSILQGFGLGMTYFSLLVIIPLIALFAFSFKLEWAQFVEIISDSQVLSALRFSLFTALIGFALVFGLVIGEFGAVAVVSGKIIGLTTTMPLYIEILYNDYLYTAAFAVASVLTLLSIIALILKCIIEKYERA